MPSEQEIWELVVQMTGRDQLKDLEEDLVDVSKAAVKVNESTKEASKGTADFGRAALEGSRAIEDLQYGIGGVLNNVPNLVMMLGGPAGLAGAISLTAVGVTQLIKHWDDLMRLMGTGEELHQTGTQLENITKRIKEINDKEVKVAVDTSELEALEKQLKAIKEAQAEFEAAQKRQKGAERESGKAVEEALAESAGGLPGVSATLRQQFVREKGAVSPELQEALAKQAELQKTIATALDPDRVRIAQAELQALFPRIKQANDNVAREAEAAAGDLLKRSKEGKGPELGAAQADLARRLGGELGRQVTAASPEALAQAQEEEDEFNRHMDRAKEAGAARRAKAAAQKKMDDAEKKVANEEAAFLNKQGEEFERGQQDAAKARIKGKAIQAQMGIKDFLARETRTIKEGGFAEQTEAMLAQGRAQGGFAGRRMTPDQQFEFVRRQAEQQFRGQFPGMGAQQRGDMAMRVTAMGQKQLNQRMADLQAREFNAVDATQIAVAETLQAVQALASKVQGQIAVANGLQRGARQMHNAAKEMQPGAGNTGRN